MLCVTHQLIAQNAFDTLQSELKITLDHKSLMEGSIAPDFNPLMVVIPHVKTNQSLGFVNKLVEKLTNLKVSEGVQADEEFSYKLGVIIHFISDFFCRAHNDIKYLNPITHYFYEKRLKYYFSNCMNKAKLMVITDKNRVTKSIREFIEEKHREYLKEAVNMENDFYYANSLVIAISLDIVSTCLKKSVPELLLNQFPVDGKTA